MASANTSTLSPQLTDLERQFEANSEHVRRMWANARPEQLSTPGLNGAWSPGACVAHLTLATQEYLPILDDAFQSTPIGAGPYKKDWMGALLAWSLEPPYRIKTKTLARFVPRSCNPRQVLAEFLESQGQLQQRLKRGNALALDKAKIRSPFNERIRYNLFSVFHIIAAHQRRHLWQAKQAIRAQQS